MAEVDHQQGHGGGDHSGDGGDAQDLGVDVLHHLAGLGPEGVGSQGGLGQLRRHAGSEKAGIEDAAIVPVLFLRSIGERAFSVQSITSFFVPENENSAHSVGRCPLRREHEKRRLIGVLPLSFSLVITVLSMIIVAYIDLRFNSKTLSIHS